MVGFECTPEIELIPVRSHVYVTGRQESRVTPFGSEHLKNRVAISYDGRGCREIKYVEVTHEFHFGHPTFGDMEQTVGNTGLEFREKVWAREINVGHGRIHGI